MFPCSKARQWYPDWVDTKEYIHESRTNPIFGLLKGHIIITTTSISSLKTCFLPCRMLEHSTLEMIPPYNYASLSSDIVPRSVINPVLYCSRKARARTISPMAPPLIPRELEAALPLDPEPGVAEAPVSFSRPAVIVTGT